jgi:tRNA U34 5-methylaminomethyl-2-thiouridine-forming methyltransferase MnmC
MTLFVPSTLRLKRLKDGSLSLEDSELQETFHNWQGAFAEASEHYAKPALSRLSPNQNGVQSLHVWDVCFGLGYNSFAFIQELLEQPWLGELQHIRIQAVERNASLHPLWAEVLAQAHFRFLNEQLNYSQTQASFGYELIFSPKQHTYPLPSIRIELYISDALVVLPQWASAQHEPIDLIFHDAFSPAKVPHLWTAELFECYASVLSPTHGAILTYSLARQVKNAVESAGLTWQKLPPLGWKNGAMLITHKPITESCLTTSPYGKGLG